VGDAAVGFAQVQLDARVPARIVLQDAAHVRCGGSVVCNAQLPVRVPLLQYGLQHGVQHRLGRVVGGYQNAYAQGGMQGGDDAVDGRSGRGGKGFAVALPVTGRRCLAQHGQAGLEAVQPAVSPGGVQLAQVGGQVGAVLEQVAQAACKQAEFARQLAQGLR